MGVGVAWSLLMKSDLGGFIFLKRYPGPEAARRIVQKGFIYISPILCFRIENPVALMFFQKKDIANHVSNFIRKAYLLCFKI